MATLTLPDGRVMMYAAFGAPDGRPVLYFHGTPGTGEVAALVEEAGRANDLRVIAPTRPGYGGTTLTPPGLASVARDTLALADALGLDRFLTHGVSGGGPYAVAAAAVAPERVDGVLVSGGPGRHLEVTPVLLSEAERHALELAAAGDTDGATRAMEEAAKEDLGPLLDLDVDSFADAFRGRLPPGRASLDHHPDQRRVLMTEMWRGLRTLDGYVRDNLSWGAAWDVDLDAVTSPTVLVHGDRDGMVPVAHGEWLARHLPGAERVVLEDADHGAVTVLRLDEQYRRLQSVAR